MKGFVKAIVSLPVILALAVVLIAAGPAAAQEQSLRLAANAVGTIMYAFSSGISQVADKNAGLKIELLPQGNVTAFPMFATDECDLVMSAADELDAAYYGKDIYGKLTGGQGVDMRVLMLGTRIAAGLLVAGDSGITKCEDIKGKRVTLDFGTHYALNMGSRAALYGCGLSEEDVIVVKATLIPDALRKVMEGKADACYGSIGVPVFRELEAAPRRPSYRHRRQTGKLEKRSTPSIRVTSPWKSSPPRRPSASRMARSTWSAAILALSAASIFPMTWPTN